MPSWSEAPEVGHGRCACGAPLVVDYWVVCAASGKLMGGECNRTRSPAEEAQASMVLRDGLGLKGARAAADEHAVNALSARRAYNLERRRLKEERAAHIDAVHQKIQAKIKEKRARRYACRASLPAPRYDDVFLQGVEWLDGDFEEEERA